MGHLRRAALAASGLGLVALLLLASTAAAQGLEGPEDPLKEGVEYQWWDADWHMRVPVLVRPQMPDAVVDGRNPPLEGARDVPVHAEVDFTEVIRQVGDSPDERWPQRVDGSLNSFTFDEDSVRLVRYDRDTGTTISSGDTGELVPHDFVPTLTERRELKNGRFDASANAVGTVTWVAEGRLDEPRLYFVYFDIEENGEKPEPGFSPSDKGPLNSLYWIRPGTDSYGYAPASSSGDPLVEVHGLHEDTAVQFRRYSQAGFDPVPVESCEDTNTGLCVEGGEKVEGLEEPTFELEPISEMVDAGRDMTRLQVESPQETGYFFHVKADKPVLVSVRNPPHSCPTQLFYPGEQGLVSRSFEFVPLQGGPSPVCGDYTTKVIAPQDQAKVTWTWLDSGEEARDSPLTISAGGSQELELPDDAAGRPVEVEASEPVSVVRAGYRPQRVGTQAPTAYGAPVGEQAIAPMYNELQAVPWEAQTEVTAFDLQNPQEGRFEEPGGPGAGSPAHVQMSGNEVNDYGGNVFATSGDGGERMSVYQGDAGFNPIAGEDGREFRVPLDLRDGDRSDNAVEKDRMILFPPYDRTDVVVTDNRTGEEVFNGTANQHGFLDERNGEDVFPAPGGYHVSSSKPLLGYKVNAVVGGDYATYYPSVTRSPLYEDGPATFHGNLIRWDEPLRTPTMAPGQERTFTLSLTNLGREIGGSNLPDDITIEQDVTGNGSVTLSTQRIRNLDSFESRDVKVVAEIPEDADTGDSLVVDLAATSEGNPEFQAFTELKITVKTLFRVEMSFRDSDCNPKNCERLVDSGDSTLYAINVNNTGTGDDAYSFSLSDSQAGYEAQVEHQNGSVLATQDESRDVLPVKRGQEKVVFLNVTAPDDASVAFPYEAVVQAISENDNKRDQVTALTRLSVNTDFRLEVEDDTHGVVPGENATFRLRAVNEGDDTVLDVTTSDPSLEGWNVSVDPPDFLIRANGTTAPDGTRGDVREILVNVTASDDARVGQVLPLEVTATPGASQGDDGESAEVRAVVENSFDLETSGLQPRSLQPGETFRYQFQVRNDANGPFAATVNATDLPDGWRFEKSTPSEATDLGVGDSVDVSGDLVLPPGSPAGRYNVTFTVFGETPDGDQGTRDLTGLVQVGRRANLAVEPPAPTTPVPPGDGTRVPLNVTNAGNVDLTAELTLDAPDGWSVALMDEDDQRLPLEPGESRTVDVLLQAPGEIGDGPVEWGVEADLPLRSPQSFTFGADWIRRDLVVNEVQAVTQDLDPGDVGVLAVTVVNRGDLPANNVDLSVVADGERVSNATIETLPPNDERVVQMEWTIPSSLSDLQVVVDPDDDFVETDETNNARGFSPASQSSIPAPNPLAAATLVAVLVLVRRRWTP